MIGYVKLFESIKVMLQDFLHNGINESKLVLLDQVRESSEIDQFKVLNSYRTLDIQRTFFGAWKNIENILRTMRLRLERARITHENPTSIEASLEMMDYLVEMAPLLDSFVFNGQIDEIKRLNEQSRIVYKKANALGLYQDISSQIKEAKLTKDQVTSFTAGLNQNLSEIETEDELC
jgi:hypothetical protein